MDVRETGRIEGEIVRAVSGNVGDVMDGEWEDREWVHLFVDIEIDGVKGRSSSITFALAQKPGRALERIAFRLSSEAKQGFHDLAHAMCRSGEPPWSSAQLQIERGGAFAFAYYYGPPYRLGGQLIDTRFENYLPEWLQTPTGTRFTQTAKWPGLLKRLGAFRLQRQ